MLSSAPVMYSPSLDDYVLAVPGLGDGQRRVERRRHAEVDHVHVGQLRSSTTYQINDIPERLR
jgi:hypothetical protein